MFACARRWARLWLITAVTLCLLTVAQAQTTPDFEIWETDAERVEQALAVGAASDAALETMRSDVAGWREQFLQMNTLGASRIQTLNRRIDALPAAPAEGETELEAVAAARVALQTQLSQLQEPAIKAQLAFAHADGLVREIDETLRERQTTVIVRRVPTPLNPLNLGQPLAEISKIVTAVPLEIANLFGNTDERKGLRQTLPGALVIAAIGVLLVARAGLWTNGLMRWMQGLSRPLFVLLGEITAAVLQLVLPLGGLILLVAAISVSGLLGDTGTLLFRSLGGAGLLAILGLWLVARIYPSTEESKSPASQILSDRHALKARSASHILVVVLSLRVGLDDLVGTLQIGDLTEAYLSCILIFPCSYAIFRLGRLYRRPKMVKRTDLTDPDEPGGQFILSVVAGLARVARGLAILSLPVALVGYINLAEAVVFPMGTTFLIIAGLGRVQGLVARLFAVLRPGRSSESDSLTPVLINGVLSIAALPLLALIWGARPADLKEIWTGLREGVSLGGVHVSPSTAVMFMVVFGLGFLATRFVQGLMSQTVFPRTHLDIGAQRAMTSGIGYIGIFLAALLAITATGIDLSSLAIVAGALSVGIGFGLQTIVSNFVSGIILLIERPVSEGDWIEVAGEMGIVKRISVRATRIETFDRTDVIVPNSDLVSGLVTNWTRGNLIGRAIIPVGVAYDSDTRQVEAILREVAEAQPLVTMSPPPQVLFIGFGASSMDFEIRAILRDINFLLSVKSEINHEIARRFSEEGIQIPFPQQDLWLRNAETLRDGADAAPRHPTTPKGRGTPAPQSIQPTPGARNQLEAGDMSSPDDAGDGAR